MARAKQKKEKPKLEKKTFAPSSLKQMMVLQENDVDILLTGGGRLCLHVKNNSLNGETL